MIRIVKKSVKKHEGNYYQSKGMYIYIFFYLKDLNLWSIMHKISFICNEHSCTYLKHFHSWLCMCTLSFMLWTQGHLSGRVMVSYNRNIPIVSTASFKKISYFCVSWSLAKATQMRWHTAQYVAPISWPV